MWPPTESCLYSKVLTSHIPINWTQRDPDGYMQRKQTASEAIPDRLSTVGRARSSASGIIMLRVSTPLRSVPGTADTHPTIQPSSPGILVRPIAVTQRAFNFVACYIPLMSQTGQHYWHTLLLYRPWYHVPATAITITRIHTYFEVMVYPR